MTIKVLYNYLLVRLGIRKILPARIVNRKKVRECGQALICSNSSDILYDDNVEMRCARAGMMERLEKAATSIRETYGLKLLVYELYRSPQKQEWLRKRDREEIITAHPEYGEEQIQSALNRISAGVGGSGHQTGGAVDLTLCDDNGIPLDMGTAYLEHNEKVVTGSRDLMEEQHRNRTILLKAMHAAGFVNYPGEWWHFCYGDKMWAAYSHKPYAIYDAVK